MCWYNSFVTRIQVWTYLAILGPVSNSYSCDGAIGNKEASKSCDPNLSKTLYCSFQLVFQSYNYWNGSCVSFRE